ncbi:MAG TPA: hydroxylamine reductase [Anaerolineae bacterium]|nr:hydroxylamine reductase [Anaerolineae bacterium]HPL27728.1 hydroxylamine reductase [Anaerolineae bacterium]
MFCNQCQETAKNQACTQRGICGKDAEVAALQDLVVYLAGGIALYGTRARALGVSDPEADLFVAEALFATVTNVNFDPDRFVALAQRALELRERLRGRFLRAYEAQHGRHFAEALPEAATWAPRSAARDELLARGMLVGITAGQPDEDVRSARSLLLYGLKGLAAYADHAEILGHHEEDLLAYMQDALAMIAGDAGTVDELLAMALRCGEMGVRAMALLDQANTSTYGQPSPTQVSLEVRQGPAILISGHDLRDLEELLQQTADSGINVYTHGEMLPAHAYPELKKHAHLAGNYGGAWWQQRDEFDAFGGAILLTTNCLVPPKASYRDRLFTTGLVGWPGVTHIADRAPGGQKDFRPVIARALDLGSPRPLEQGAVTTGFAHGAVLSLAGPVLDAVKRGAIKRFVVMAGCDGRQKEREYYTELARRLPQDTVILTAGCAKYRYNKLGLGDIDGIPRLLDAGQCNDSYSLVVVALKLAEALGLESVNDLPIDYALGWYEQKAVLVLLALLSLGVKRIRLGPTVPAFISPNVLQALVDKFEIGPTTTVDEDLAAMIAAA